MQSVVHTVAAGNHIYIQQLSLNLWRYFAGLFYRIRYVSKVVSKEMEIKFSKCLETH